MMAKQADLKPRPYEHIRFSVGTRFQLVQIFKQAISSPYQTVICDGH